MPLLSMALPTTVRLAFSEALCPPTKDLARIAQVQHEFNARKAEETHCNVTALDATSLLFLHWTDDRLWNI